MATKGNKTKFAFGTDGTAYTDIAKVVNVKVPQPTAADIDTTTMDSPDDFQEFEAGLAEGGEAEITVQFDKTQATTLYGLFRQNKKFRVTFSEGSAWRFDGYIKKYGDEVDREKLVQTTVTVKVSGKPEFVAASQQQG